MRVTDSTRPFDAYLVTEPRGKCGLCSSGVRCVRVCLVGPFRIAYRNSAYPARWGTAADVNVHE